MLPYVVFLAMPLLGALLLAAEHFRRSGETPLARRAGRSAVVCLGGVAGLTGVCIAALLAAYLLSGTPTDSLARRVMTTITVSLVTALILFAARNALRIDRKRYDEESVAGLADRARDSEEVRLAGWLLFLAPLLVFAVLGLIVLLPLLVFGVFYWTARRARESQFLWTLALAVEHNLALDDEVDAFSRTLWGRSRLKYLEVAARLREGRALIDALEIGGVLPRPLVAELRAAQTAGTLPQALRQAAATYTASLLQNRFDGSIAVVSVYLWALISAIYLVVSFIMYWIVPKFKDIFNDFDVPLPAWTVQAIRLGDSLADNFLVVMPLVGLPIVAGLAAVIVGVFGWGNLDFPLLMRWFPRWDAPGVLASLAHAVESGRPIPASLDDMAEHQRRSDLRERLVRMQQLTDVGRPLWTVLGSEGFIRNAEAAALEASARAGNLPWAMRTLADSMQRTSRHRVQFWLEFIKPAAVVSVGCVVAFFVIAFFLPLVTLIQELTNDIR